MALSFLAKGKGQIKIEVTNRVYNPGEFVDVHVHLTTKKDLGPGRLYGALVANERIEHRRRNHDGHMHTDVEHNEIYRWEVDLGVDASFPSGTDEQMTFGLQIPPPPPENSMELPGWLGGMAQVAAWFGPHTSVEWEVEVRYDIPRLDLSDREKISVNM